MKPIVDNYVSYLNTKLSNATGSLLTYSRAKKIGCNPDSNSCVSAPNWVYSTDYRLGTANSDNDLWYVYSYDGEFAYDSISNSGYGVRPVITITTSDIQ